MNATLPLGRTTSRSLNPTGKPVLNTLGAINDCAVWVAYVCSCPALADVRAENLVALG